MSSSSTTTAGVGGGAVTRPDAAHSRVRIGWLRGRYVGLFAVFGVLTTVVTSAPAAAFVASSQSPAAAAPAAVVPPVPSTGRRLPPRVTTTHVVRRLVHKPAKTVPIGAYSRAGHVVTAPAALTPAQLAAQAKAAAAATSEARRLADEQAQAQARALAQAQASSLGLPTQSTDTSQAGTTSGDCSSSDVATVCPATQHLEAASAATSPTDTAATADDLAAALKQAESDWAARYPNADLTGITASLGDLQDLALGSTTGTAITIDATAAGWGWSVDFPAEPATQHMDLLTVVRHEVGHAVGLLHEASGLMAESLQPGDVFAVPAGLDMSPAQSASPTGSSAGASANPAKTAGSDPSTASTSVIATPSSTDSSDSSAADSTTTTTTTAPATSDSAALPVESAAASAAATLTVGGPAPDEAAAAATTTSASDSWVVVGTVATFTADTPVTATSASTRAPATSTS